MEALVHDNNGNGMRKFIISNSKNVNESSYLLGECVCCVLFGINIAYKQNKPEPTVFTLLFVPLFHPALALALIFPERVCLCLFFNTKYHGNSSISPVICPFLFNRLELSATASHRFTSVRSALVLTYSIFIPFFSPSSSSSLLICLYSWILYIFLNVPLFVNQFLLFPLFLCALFLCHRFWVFLLFTKWNCSLLFSPFLYFRAQRKNVENKWTSSARISEG